jgi:hypothetical protein
MNDALVESLRGAVEAAPDDLTLRSHLAELVVLGAVAPDADHWASVSPRSRTPVD